MSRKIIEPRKLRCMIFGLSKNLIIRNAVKEYETSKPMTMYEPKMTENVRQELEKKKANLK